MTKVRTLQLPLRSLAAPHLGGNSARGTSSSASRQLSLLWLGELYISRSLESCNILLVRLDRNLH